MRTTYDIRLTLRNFLNVEEILKQYLVKKVTFVNFISTGDKLHFRDQTGSYAFFTEGVEIYHTPRRQGADDHGDLPATSPIIYADSRVTRDHLPQIEKILTQYSPHKLEEF